MTIVNSYTNQKKFFILASLIGLCLSLYVACVAATISNTLTRQRAEREIAALQTRVSELEFQYVSLTSSVTLERAKSLGFIEVHDFTVARDVNVALSR
jgi:hypothetical protein